MLDSKRRWYGWSQRGVASLIVVISAVGVGWCSLAHSPGWGWIWAILLTVASAGISEEESGRSV